MPNATEEEIREATRKWFNVLEILNRIVARNEREEKAEHCP
jgi:hypothetical protein